MKIMNKEISNEYAGVNSNSMKYDFTIFRPGGNDTCLVLIDAFPPIEERRRINSFIQKMYPNVEQVGFLKTDPLLPELVMAGGEFCGNATRSAAWQSLKGKPGEIRIKVSGAKRRLRAGVTADGEVFAQMPIYSNTQNIIEDSGKTGNYTVSMEGITHYIEFNISQLDGLTPEEIKEKSMKEIARRRLNQESAAGIIYVTKNETDYKIIPVVYVRDVNSLYLESACGSGTTALGIILALRSGKSIVEVPVIQPSGMPIKISVDYDGKKFIYAQIQGLVKKLYDGTIRLNKI
jgi:diaminopimelate epimerase